MSTVIDALQAALAAEQAIVYGYGVVGGQIGAGREAGARQAYDAHRSRRDVLIRTAVDLGAAPVAADAGYALPFAVVDPAGALRLAAYLEERVAGAYGGLTLVVRLEPALGAMAGASGSGVVEGAADCAYAAPARRAQTAAAVKVALIVMGWELL